MPKRKTIAQRCLAFSGLFEAEVLVELMLRYWNHPLADDKEFRNSLLEGAAAVLRASISGQKLLEDIPAHDMNFIAAIWYAEWNASQSDDVEGSQENRQKWLDTVRRSIPSCFCAPDQLGG